MAGFGLRSLKKHNDQSTVEGQRSYHRNIVMGETLFGYLTFNKIFEISEGKAVFLTRNTYLSEQINNDLACTMNAVRDSEVADELGFEQLEVRDATKTPLFYKDTKFHKFGARAKPHPLLPGEEFFSKPFYQVDLKLDINDEVLAANQVRKIIKKIRVCEPTDLVEPVRFELFTGDGDILTCEKLYFCENPRDFYRLVENKEALSEEVKKYLVAVETNPGITVHFECKGKFSDHVGSMIIPQSMTHEWGNFIIDIGPFENGYQNFKAMTFIDADDLQEEDLAKKIRLMRKVLERVMPELEKCECVPTIKFDSDLRYQGMNDELSGKLRNEDIRFVGPGAPLSHPKSELFQYFARAAMSLSQI